MASNEIAEAAAGLEIPVATAGFILKILLFLPGRWDAIQVYRYCSNPPRLLFASVSARTAHQVAGQVAGSRSKDAAGSPALGPSLNIPVITFAVIRSVGKF